MMSPSERVAKYEADLESIKAIGVKNTPEERDVLKKLNKASVVVARLAKEQAEYDKRILRQEKEWYARLKANQLPVAESRAMMEAAAADRRRMVEEEKAEEEKDSRMTPTERVEKYEAKYEKIRARGVNNTPEEDKVTRCGGS